MGATILVVDDDPIKRQLLRELLTYEGHETVEAEDGCQALSLTRTHLPDLVLLDLMMPTQNGHEYLVELRADPMVARTRVVIYSALDPFDDQITIARAYGVEYVIPLPCEPEDLLQMIRQALSGTPGPIQRMVGGALDRLEKAIANLQHRTLQRTAR